MQKEMIKDLEKQAENLPESIREYILPWIKQYGAEYLELDNALSGYLSAVEEIKKKRETFTKDLSKDERKQLNRMHLQKLLNPYIIISKYNPVGEYQYKKDEDTYRFVRERIWINKELDVDNLVYNHDKYEINFDFDKPLNPSDYAISIHDESKKYVEYRKTIEKEAKEKGVTLPSPSLSARTPGDFSLVELYKGVERLDEEYEENGKLWKAYKALPKKGWLDSLSEATIKSHDLLDQILVCFTIKRAQSGDKKACKKLYSIYQGRAQSGETIERVKQLIASRLDTEKGINKLDASFYLTPDVNFGDIEEDIKANASFLLYMIIGGFKPQGIIEQLISGDTDHLPRKLTEIYLSYLLYYVPDNLQKALTNLYQTEKMLSLYERTIAFLKAKGINESTIEAFLEVKDDLREIRGGFPSEFQRLFNPYTPIRDYCYYTYGEDKTKGVNEFFKCYIPNKMGPNHNLTTWIFGGIGKGYVYGKLYQTLKDHYYREAERRGDKISAEDESFPKDYYNTEEVQKRFYEGTWHHHPKTKAEVKLEEITEQAGLSRQDLIFILDASSGDYTLDELANKYNITKDQVRYKKDKILKKLQKRRKN